MDHARKKIILLVCISTLIIIGIWIAWIIVYHPYSWSADTANNNLLDDINQQTQNVKKEMEESQQQWDMLQQFFENKLKTTTTTTSGIDANEIQ